MSDTPETDARYWRDYGKQPDPPTGDEMRDFARILERERNQARQERDELKEALEHAAAFVVAFTMAAPSLAELPMNYSISDTGEQGEITPNQIIAMSEKALEKLKENKSGDV
jgi:hypothetical protein